MGGCKVPQTLVKEILSLRHMADNLRQQRHVMLISPRMGGLEHKQYGSGGKSNQFGKAAQEGLEHHYGQFTSPVRFLR